MTLFLLGFALSILALGSLIYVSEQLDQGEA